MDKFFFRSLLLSIVSFLIIRKKIVKFDIEDHLLPSGLLTGRSSLIRPSKNRNDEVIFDFEKNDRLLTKRTI